MAALVGSNQDGKALASTGRSLLLTLLGEFVLPGDGSVWTQTLITALDRLGVREKAARQAVSRLSERGWLEGTRIGRQTRWALSTQGTEMLTQGAARIYGLGSEQRIWTGQWLVLVASVPERDRNLRHRLGRELSWAGFGLFRPGTWISPWPENENVLVPMLDRLGVKAFTFRAELGQLGSGPELIAQAWDLAELAGAYRRFLDDAEPLMTLSPQGDDAAVSLAGLVHRWRRFPFLDPELPAALMPADWPGPDAARRFSELRGQLNDPAIAWWQAIEAEHTDH